MKRIKSIANAVFLFNILSIVASCSGQNQNSPWVKTETAMVTGMGEIVSDLGNDIDCIMQDRKGNYWFASNGNGAYCYDGKTLRHITGKHGLCSNFVIKIEEDFNGRLWFTTRDGICSFDGSSFADYTETIVNAPPGNLNYTHGGIFFGHLNGICFYDGKSFTNFTIQPASYSPPPGNMNRPYSIYSVLIDKAGNIWFGTQEKGVCRYNGISFSFFTANGLDKAAVRTLFQDKAGTIWAGNNGAGLFRFKGNMFENFTEVKGLANPDFLKSLKGKEATLARPWTINQDDAGNLWIGTIDAGVWKYNGDSLKNYTTRNGLAGNAIWIIYKDHKGELWFVTNGDSVCKFSGDTFTKYSFTDIH